MTNQGYYYCLAHKSVEAYDACKAGDRLGPYATRDDAADALEQVRVRNDAWANDPRYNDANDREVDVDDEGYNVLDETR